MSETDLTTVYQYFAGNGALIYVGITNRGTRRLHEHADSKPWWPLATGCTLEHFGSRGDASTREKYLIETYRPPYNSQHNPEAALPLDERVNKRLRSAKPWTDPGITQRRKAWYKLGAAEKLIAPCVRCGRRPGISGPTCINCRQVKDMTRVGPKWEMPIGEHVREHKRLLAAGETHCPICQNAIPPKGRLVA